jgi:hypothetical protein
MVAYAFVQNKSSQSTFIKALHTPWCHVISSLQRVSLAEYLLVLRALFPLLLQMVRCIMGIVSTVCIWRWATTGTKGNGHSVFLIWCFCWRWLLTGTLSKLSVCVVLKLLASAMLIWTCVIITLCSKLWCIQLLLRTLCNMWRWLLNQYDLGWNVGWFEILCDFTESRIVRA